jgi:nitrile hydratase
MNGVHDMGGMHGFGPIDRRAAPSAETSALDYRIRALMRLTIDRELYNLDAFRYGIEQMAPAHYLRAPYHERWLTSVVFNLAEAGVISEDELAARMELLQQQPDAEPVHPAPTVPPVPAREARQEPTPASVPRFAVGDAVIARNIHPVGHTRLPRYVRGKRGVIRLIHGLETFPDSNAHGRGEHSQPVYNVEFDGRELWGAAAEPNHVVSIDLWETYLEPAPVEKTPVAGGLRPVRNRGERGWRTRQTRSPTSRYEPRRWNRS